MEENKEIIAINNKLQPFLKYNPTACLEIDGKDAIIKNPWDDSSLGFKLSNDNDLLIDALNHVLLPNQLTAIYHVDTFQLEFIFTIRDNEDNIWKRDFRFSLNRNDYHCYYGASTDRLINIAKSLIEFEP